MRTFDIRCHNCGDMNDVRLDAPKGRVKMSELMNWEPVCLNCDHPVTIIVPAVLTVGPMESKPINLGGQLNRQITSNAEWRDYQKKNPNARPVSVTDQSWKDHYNQVRELAEQRSQQQGYRGFYDKKEQRRKEKIAEGKLKP